MQVHTARTRDSTLGCRPWFTAERGFQVRPATSVAVPKRRISSIARRSAVQEPRNGFDRRRVIPPTTRSTASIDTPSISSGLTKSGSTGRVEAFCSRIPEL